MVKNASGLFLLVLVLVGAGVVLLGPQLTGYINIPNSEDITQPAQFVEIFYATNWSYNSSYVLNPLNALGNSSPNYAVLQYSTSNSHFCPVVNSEYYSSGGYIDGGKWCHFKRNQSLFYIQSNNSFGEDNYTSPKFRGWLSASFGSIGINAYRNVSIQVNASNLKLGCTQCNSKSTKYYIQYNIHGTVRGSYYSNLITCSLAAGEKGKICSVEFLVGFNNSVSILVARANLLNSRPDPAIHWIRLLAPTV